MAIPQLKRRMAAKEKREALVKVLMIICSILAASPLADWMVCELCGIRKGGIRSNTADRSLFMVGRGGVGWRVEGWRVGGGVIKLSASLMQWSHSSWKGQKREGRLVKCYKSNARLNTNACVLSGVCSEVCVCVSSMGAEFAQSRCWRQCVEQSLCLFSGRGTLLL